MKDAAWAAERDRMVEQQIKSRGLTDEKLLEAFRSVPRHCFVPEGYLDSAYEDYPLPIGQGQTISQPYIVALMTYLLQLTGEEIVLEIGTGSGYQAAILSKLARQVISIEIHPELADQAGKILNELGYSNVEILTGDGSGGLPARAPFDAILIAASAPQVPQPLYAQLTPAGRLVLPAGSRSNQELQLWQMENGIPRCTRNIPVAFVPLQGKYGWGAEEE